MVFSNLSANLDARVEYNSTSGYFIFQHKTTKTMKVLHCSDAGFDCSKVIKAESEEEVLQQAAVHAKSVHQVDVTPQMAEQIRTLIKEESPSA